MANRDQFRKRLSNKRRPIDAAKRQLAYIDGHPAVAKITIRPATPVKCSRRQRLSLQNFSNNTLKVFIRASNQIQEIIIKLRGSSEDLANVKQQLCRNWNGLVTE